MDMGALTLKGKLEKAWVVIHEHQEPTCVIGIFAPQLASSAMLQIVEQLYASYVLTPDEQMRVIQGEQIRDSKAGYMYLNDGSTYEDHIICGENPRFAAMLVDEVALYTDPTGAEYIAYKYASMLVENNERVVYFWDDPIFPVALPGLFDRRGA